MTISSRSFCCICYSICFTEKCVGSSLKFCAFSFCSCSERYWPLPGENHSFPPPGLSFSQLGEHQTGSHCAGGTAHTLQVTTHHDMWKKGKMQLLTLWNLSVDGSNHFILSWSPCDDSRYCSVFNTDKQHSQLMLMYILLYHLTLPEKINTPFYYEML